MNVASLPDQNLRVRSMNPKKFALWLFIITVTMIFASLTSAYIVKKSAGDWLIFDFPRMFAITSGIIVMSSITIQWAYHSAKQDDLFKIRLGLMATLLLAIAFTVGQYLSWGELVAQDVYFVGNAAGSFIYVFTGLHAAHLIGGIVFLIVVLINVFRYKIHSKSLSQLEMCVTYWHFLGGLWLYLYIFLVVNNS